MGDARIDAAARIDAIEKRANEASEGPWRHHVGDSQFEQPWHSVKRTDTMLQFGYENVCNGIYGKDAEFIAAARSDVPALVAEVRESASECEKLKAALRAIRDFPSGRHHEGMIFARQTARALVGSAPPNESTKRFGLHCGECGAEVTGQNDEIVDVAAGWSFSDEGWRCPLHPLVGRGSIQPPPAHGEGWEFDDGG